MDAPTGEFGLTTYNSQLVLVGGVEMPTKQYHNNSPISDLWLSSDGRHWERTLPPMLAARYRPLTVNTGTTPECLVVAGGYENPEVEVYRDGKWSFVTSLPFDCDVLSSTIHNGAWFVGGGKTNDSTHAFDSTFVYCDVKVLVSAAKKGANDSKLLKKSPISFHDELLLASYEEELFIIENSSGKISAYSPCSQCWIHMGNTPGQLSMGSAIVSYNAAQVLVMGGSCPVLPGVSHGLKPRVHQAVMQCESSAPWQGLARERSWLMSYGTTIYAGC